MFTGMIFIFAPLVVGYLFSISNTQDTRIHQSLLHRALIYVILALDGIKPRRAR